MPVSYPIGVGGTASEVARLRESEAADAGAGLCTRDAGPNALPPRSANGATGEKSPVRAPRASPGTVLFSRSSRSSAWLAKRSAVMRSTFGQEKGEARAHTRL